MSMSEIAIFLGLAAVMIFTQIGRHTFTLRRLILPLVVSVLVGRQYLQSIPTVGGNLDFAMLGAAFGVACGLLAAATVRMERDAATGKVIAWAGIGYAMVWIVALGGRLAFAYEAQHGLSSVVRQFSIDHALTAGGWTAAFVLMALAMVLTRTAVNGVRALLLAGGQPRRGLASLRNAA
jgi:hypothetical protein